MTQRKKKLVVIGNGMAGARFVEDLVARGGTERHDVVVYGDERYGNYNRILLSGVLAGGYKPDDIYINPLAWYPEHGVTLRAGVRVEKIDLDHQTVHGADGQSERYDRLVIATGSVPLIPAMKGARREDGALKDGVCVFRSLDDCDAILRETKRSKRAIVIGGGLLGLEAARGILEHGLEVHVVHLMSHLMEMQLDGTGAAILQRKLEDLGLHVHLKKNTTEILGDDRATGLRFEDGSTLLGDLVVVAAGIRPNVALARDAGLLVERGIVVTDDLRAAGEDNVFAVGECAQHRGRTYGLVAPLWEQTAVLADRLSGKNPQAIYEGSRVSTKLKVMGVDLHVMGARDATADDEDVVFMDARAGIYKKLVVRDGKLIGATLLGDTATGTTLTRAFELGLKLPSDRAELLFASIGAAAATTICDAPDVQQVCNCNGVSKGAILAAVRGGKRTLKQLCEATRAGTGCGSCKGDVGLLLESAAGTVVEDPSIHYYVPGVPLPKPALVAAIEAQGLKSVSSVFAALAGGKEDAASKPGLASLLKSLWGKAYVDERDARFINDRVHANIQRDGTFSVVPRIYGGVTTAAELKRIADVAERYGAKMVKITGGQRIDLLGFPKETLPDVWRELGMPSGHAYSKAFRTCKTCVGTHFCRYATGDSIGLGQKIERRFQGLESPAKLKLATAGCPRNCSEATTKDVGAVAVEGGRWELFVGGGAGSRVRKGDVLATVDDEDTALLLIGRFMQHYREHAKYGERTYDFVERVGIEELKQLLIADRDGVAAALDARMQAAVDAYVDPWLEAQAPQHPSQFKDTLDEVRAGPPLDSDLDSDFDSRVDVAARKAPRVKKRALAILEP